MKNDWRYDDRWFHQAAGEFITERMHDDDADPAALVARTRDMYAHWCYCLTEEEVCGSPIEAILLAFAMFGNDGYNELVFEPFFGQNPLPENGTVFCVQENVEGHRVDFLFIASYAGETRRLVVECDGHDFHERTKEQARRDKARDRDFVKSGAVVMRYTGSELYRDAPKCMAEIKGVLADLIRDMQGE